MRALVTAANGFLGQHMLALLAREGIDTVAVTRTACRTPAGQRNVVLPDAADRQAVRALISDVRPDLVFHLAGITSSPSIAETYAANVGYAVNLMHALQELRSDARVVLAGSAAEYGVVTADEGLVSEARVCHPISDYGISKYAQTLHGLAAAAAGLSVVIARPFNVIGPGMSTHLALGSFAAQIAGLGPRGVLKTGDLNSVRDFIDAADCVRILFQLANTKAATGQIVNVCTGVGQNIKDLTERLIILSGKSIEIEQVRRQAGNSSSSRVIGDPGRLRQFGIDPRAPDIDTVLTALLQSVSPAVV